MISGECLLEYARQYPDHDCGYEINTRGQVTIDNGEGASVIEPYEGEVDEVFMDRLNRSKEAGKNLFFDEWEKFQYEEGCEY